MHGQGAGGRSAVADRAISSSGSMSQRHAQWPVGGCGRAGAQRWQCRAAGRQAADLAVGQILINPRGRNQAVVVPISTVYPTT